MASSSATISILSNKVIKQVFGSEFLTLLNNGREEDVSSSGGGSEKKERPGGVLGVTSGDDSDGIKPSKSARTSPPNDLDMDVDSKKSEMSADAFGEIIQKRLDAVLEESKRQQKTVNQEGRLGPSIVKYDVGSHVGSFVISSDRLGVNSQCNFGSVKASTCVFKGKWQYEVQLGSKGVMQLGWATLETKFSQEKGVGDTVDSYAYDGNRLRKWNKTTAPYGETWQAGDIIGCCIDLDDGKIEYYRNGKSMGVAFNNVRRGPGIAYFPAASLAFGENIVANFGATPLQYAAEGYSPLQLQSSLDNAKTDLLLEWLSTVMSLYPGLKFYADFGITRNPDYQTLLVITNRLIEFLGPYLSSSFVVEQSFYPFFATCIGLPEKVTHSDVVNNSVISYTKSDLLLDILWTFLEESEMKNCLERLSIILMNQFRSNSLSLAYPFQHYSLHCLLALTRHRGTRRYMIRHLLFEKIKLMHFLHIRPMDETVLKDVIPQTWWSGKSPEDSEEAVSYEENCKMIDRRITDIQDLQIVLLKNLLINSDGTEKRPSSRALFLRKFRHFIRDVVRPGSVLHQPVNKAMATFFCFMRVITELYSEEVEENSTGRLPDIPGSMFYDTSISYFEMERVGGLASYLYKAHHKEVSQALSIPDYISASTPPPTTTGLANALPFMPIRREILVHADTPMPSSRNVNESSDTNSSDESTPPASQPFSPPMISIAVPQAQPSPNERSPVEGETGILSTRTNAMTMTPIPDIRPVTPILTTPAHPPSRQTPSPGRRVPDVNNTVSVSETSSGEDLPAPPPVPHFGAALLAGTPSGHNMVIPMLTDLRNFIAQGEHGFSYFPGGLFGYSGAESRTSSQPHNPAVALLGKESGTMDVRASLRELMDDSIIIYSCGVQRHMEKVVGLRTTMEEYVKALDQANESLKNPALGESERIEIQKSAAIFSEKLDEQARHVAWVKSAVFTKERQEYTYQLLKVILATLQSASAEGPLFTFVPEHYISTAINLTWCLLTQLHPTVPHSSIPDLPSTLIEVAQFVSTHFADPRIIIAEVKDTLTQALSSFICNRIMLTALEEMPSSSQVSMVKSILRPYENRAWAQSNWMLVRFWQGSGFGFQYPNPLEARRAFRAKPVQDEFGISTNLPPTPSFVLQTHVANVLLENQTFAVSYVHSVLNQLNWAFSEFVGLLQEIQNAAQRPERVFIEARQLKICCTCFELTQALLRVMEMVCSISSPIMMDSSRESAEPLLARLCMLLSQILNRIGSNTGCFAQVTELDIPGLENIAYYPLLSAVAGILVSLIGKEVDKSEGDEMIATKALITEPSFQIDSLNFFFGVHQPQLQQGKDAFSLHQHVPNDISEAEIDLLERVLSHLASWSQKLQMEIEDVDDDEICTICYAYPKNTTFKPCNHRACKACILHHLMNKGECFFCKAVIQQVFTDDGIKIHDLTTIKKTEDHNRRSV